MHQDYILRMIQQLSGFLIRVLRLREEGELEAALTEVSDAYGRIAGLPASLVHALSEEDLVAMLRSQGRLDPERCFALAELLREEAHLYEDLDSEEESAPRFRKALRLYLEVFEDPEDLPFRLDVTGLEELIDRMSDEPLPAPTRRRLVAYLVTTGRFDRAENVVLWSLEQPDPAGEMRQEAIDFYEMLLRKPDHELLEGGLPRDEVEAGLARLREPLPLPGERQEMS
ncbi:MAG TPA: DUF6483 family protein [Thermomicrobiales bacterium]